MNKFYLTEKRIALGAFIIAIFGWIGIKPEHFKTSMFWCWEQIKHFGSYIYELFKVIIMFVWDMILFSIQVPISLLLIFSTVLIVLIVRNKQLNSEQLDSHENQDDFETDEPLSDLNERQIEVLLDIYDYAGPHKSYESLIHSLRIDVHMLGQAIDQLIDLDYLVVSNHFGKQYANISVFGRDEVIRFIENKK
jgi:hypothetical protein